MTNRIISFMSALMLLSASMINASASDNSFEQDIPNGFDTGFSNEQDAPEDVQDGDGPSSGLNIDYNEFSRNMNTFLNNAGFDYSEFESQRFNLPDISDITTSADIREQYSAMLADFSSFVFGSRATLPENSGYSMNVIGSFQDSFGNGLASNFTNYEFTFDTSSVFKNAIETRDSLFANAMSGSDYQLVSQNLNVSGALATIEQYKIDPASIDTSMADIDTLKGRVQDYYNNDNTRNAEIYGDMKSDGGTLFDSRIEEMESVKTKLDIQSSGWFEEEPDIYMKGGKRLANEDQRNFSIETWRARTNAGSQARHTNGSVDEMIAGNLNSWDFTDPTTGVKGDLNTIYQSQIALQDSWRSIERESGEYATLTEDAGSLIGEIGEDIWDGLEWFGGLIYDGGSAVVDFFS